MLRLMLLRHAKTERLKNGQHDRERRLTKRGRADAANVARYMISHCLVPDQVIVSPARRTQETWALLAKAFSEGPNVVTDERVYEASAENLIDVIGKAHEGQSLLVVGHNPSLHDLAVQLIGSGNATAREQRFRHSVRFAVVSTPALVRGLCGCGSHGAFIHERY